MPENDFRNIRTGDVIPTSSYCDQPYIVRARDGAWVCITTTGSGHEGAAGQHVVSLRSTDRGKTWESAVDVEPSDGPEASYAVAAAVPGGRIYVFYNYNRDNLREVKCSTPPYVCGRVDTLGAFVYKYSDDCGRTWSAERYEIPVREFEIDRENPYGGAVRFMWNVGRPTEYRGALLVPLHKVGEFGEGFMARSEGVLLRCANIFSETDPGKLVWETLPDGDVGLRSPEGKIGEEQSVVPLSDGSLFCVWRSVTGHPVCAYSRDGGHTFTSPAFMRFADGRLMKHPRAANFIWRLSGGRYLYWFHNHGGRWYDDRNPAWVSVAREADSPEGKILRFAQPEILLYDDNSFIRMSYPDLTEEDDGSLYITETQKNFARVHRLPADFIGRLFGTSPLPAPALEWTRGEAAPTLKLPPFAVRDNSSPDFRSKNTRAGFSLDLTFDAPPADSVVYDDVSRGVGLRLTLEDGRAVFMMSDGQTTVCARSDALSDVKTLTVTADGGPGVVTFVADGALSDGGEERSFGWSRFAGLADVSSGAPGRLSDFVSSMRVYYYPLLTGEAVRLHEKSPG